MKCLMVVAIVACLGVIINCDSMINGVNRFSSTLYKTLSKFYSDNKVSSPFAADLALFMICSGARGVTNQELINVLRVPCRRQDILSKYSQLITDLTSKGDADVTIAVKMYSSKNTIIVPQYVFDMSPIFNYYAIESLEFSNATEAAKAINNWVNKKTKQQIQTIVNSENIKSGPLIIVSAIRFEAMWLNQFNPDYNQNYTFTYRDESSEDIPFMVTKKNFVHGTVQALNASFIILPYEGNKHSMVIFLPNKGTKLKYLEDNLDKINLVEIFQSLEEPSKVELRLPKFKLESSYNLRRTLKDMGLNNAYDMEDTDRDFSGLAATPITIDQVLHKAVISVQEGGTGPATKNDIESVFEVKPVTVFEVNRPFLFVILYEPKGLNLFTGSVYEPKC